MKLKHIIGMILILIGTNVFTYASSRYWTTKHVLSRAGERMDAVLRDEGLYETVCKSTHNDARLHLAIGMAGGQYYWYNDGLLFWGIGAVLTIAGFLVPKVESKARDNPAAAIR